MYGTLWADTTWQMKERRPKHLSPLLWFGRGFNVWESLLLSVFGSFGLDFIFFETNEGAAAAYVTLLTGNTSMPLTETEKSFVCSWIRN